MNLHAPILALALDFALVGIAVAIMLTVWRLLKGPGLPDRILAIDTLYMNAVALLIILGLRWQTPLIFESALLVALLGFVSTVALARYLTRGDVVE